MTQAERGLFEQVLEFVENNTDGNGQLWNDEGLRQICEPFEQRLAEAEAELERVRALAVNANEFMRSALILDEHGGDDFESECADCRLVQTIVQLCAAPLPEKKHE